MLPTPENTYAAVIGLGTMGRGIARALRGEGARVTAYDPAVDPLAVRDQGLDDVALSPDIAGAVAESDIVFEAVFEDLDVKEDVLRTISHATDAVIASNTSTFRPSVLAPFVRDPERLIIAHFFNPSDVVPLVEVVPHARTAPTVTTDVVELLKGLGKRPVVLGAESTGFVANRLQAAILRESFALVAAGIIDPEGVDEVVRSALAPRWAVAGPIGVADLGGLDVFTAVCAEIFPTLDNSEVPPDSLLDLVAAGHLGAKTGRGFYEHDSRDVQAARQRMAWMFAMGKNGKDLPPRSVDL